jgi:hypothetical protein
MKRIEGEKGENIEACITELSRALEYLTKADHSEAWAETHMCLCSAYMQRVEGDRKENLELGAKHLQYGLEVREQTDEVMKWVEAQKVAGEMHRQSALDEAGIL